MKTAGKDVAPSTTKAPTRISIEDIHFERYAGFVDKWTIEFGFSTSAGARSAASPDQVRPMIFNAVEMGIIHARRAAAKGED